MQPNSVAREVSKIRVTARGQDKEYEITCYRCHSDLEFKLSEAIPYTPRLPKYGGGWMDGVRTLHVKCPVCGDMVDTGMLR